MSKKKKKKEKAPIQKGGNNNRLFVWLGWIFPACIGLVLLFYNLEGIAGLHRDEAAFGLFAEKIMEGLRPVRGFFTIYTSPVHSYIIALTFAVLGESIWTLRFSSVLFNILAAAAYADIARRTFPNRALWAFWFLISLPLFPVFARISGENYALNAFFLFGGIWLFSVMGSNPSKIISRLGYILAGLFFYLGIWNHIVFLPTVFAVVCVYCCFKRAEIKSLAATAWMIVTGLAIGLIPKLYGVFVLGYSFFPPGGDSISPISTAFLNMIYTLGGDALYIRACGEIISSFNWFLPLCLLASAVLCFLPAGRRILKYSEGEGRICQFAVICFILSFIFTWLITPAGLIGSRIWLLPIWFVPFILAMMMPEGKKLRFAVGAVIISVNLFSLGVNYFYGFTKNGGIAKPNVYVGGRYDNSRDFIDMRSLVKKLENYNDKPIFIEDFNEHRLVFLLSKGSRHRANVIKRGAFYPPGSLIALYRRGSPGPERIGVGSSSAQKVEALSSRHYEVYQITDHGPS